MRTHCDSTHYLCDSQTDTSKHGIQFWCLPLRCAIAFNIKFAIYRLTSKVQTWPYWPGQILFLSPSKLHYGKCILNYLDTGKLPVQPLSRETDIQKFSDPRQWVSLCVFILAPLPSIHFSPTMTGGGGRQWQGSLHHKTPAGHRPQQLPHKITDTLATSKWTGPVWHTADAGRVRGKGRMAEQEEWWERWKGRGGNETKGKEE